MISIFIDIVGHPKRFCRCMVDRIIHVSSHWILVTRLYMRMVHVSLVESLHTLSDGKWDNDGIPTTLAAVVPQLTQLRNRFRSEISFGRKALRASIVAPVLTRRSPPVSRGEQDRSKRNVQGF